MRGRSRKGPNPLTRSFESNGPDVKIRGTAQHIGEKYAQLARDAQVSGDRVASENYLQHAEHYYRIVAAAQTQLQQTYGSLPRGAEDGEDFEGDDDGYGMSDAMGRVPYGYYNGNGNGGDDAYPQGAPQPNLPQARQPYRERNDRQDRQERQDRPSRGQERNQDRQDRGPDRGQDRNQERGLDRNQDRGNERDPQRGQERGQERGDSDRSDAAPERESGRRDRRERFRREPNRVGNGEGDDEAPGLPAFLTTPVRAAGSDDEAPLEQADVVNASEGDGAGTFPLRTRRRRTTRARTSEGAASDGSDEQAPEPTAAVE